MWSGKWALVSPFAMLHSVWQLIPAFRGYAQQDAQEFLCELLDKVQHELERTGTLTPATMPANQRRLIKQVLSVVNTIFHGQLLSQVRSTCARTHTLISYTRTCSVKVILCLCLIVFLGEVFGMWSSLQHGGAVLGSVVRVSWALPQQQ